MLGKGKDLAKDLNTEVTAVLIGSGVKGLADQLAEYGADRVIVVDDPELKAVSYTHLQASIKAGLPIEVPAITINVVCGSGLKCVNDAATMIMAGEADIVVAGGMENMSMAPYAMTKARFGYRMNLSLIHIYRGIHKTSCTGITCYWSDQHPVHRYGRAGLRDRG